MEYEYSISEALEVSIFIKNGQTPIFYQPTWPNGTEWANLEEAQSWATLKIESLLDEAQPHAPFGPGEDRVPRNLDTEDTSSEEPTE